MARNRKRRSDRRPQRPADSGSTPPGLATARPSHLDDAQDPLEHAAPDVELAEAQLAVGRPEFAQPADEAEEAYEEDELAEAAASGAGSGAGAGRGAGTGASPDRGEAGSGSPGRAITPSAAASPAPRGVGRLVQFLQGSWRELQRVQWPDRRQTMQATGVVIGFVIVAGVFLGVADLVASKFVTLILK